MVWADLVHTNGVGFSFQRARNSWMWRRSAAFVGKLVRRMERRVRMLKKLSTWFSQDALVGVKWNVTRLLVASQSWTSGVECVEELSRITWSSPRGNARLSFFMKPRKSA